VARGRDELEVSLTVALSRNSKTWQPLVEAFLSCALPSVSSRLRVTHQLDAPAGVPPDEVPGSGTTNETQIANSPVA
jgi:hypothetical protein